MKQFFKTLLGMLLALSAIALPMAPALATGVFDLPGTAAGQAPWAIDEADVISRVNEGQLNNALEKLEAQTGKGVKLVALRRLDFDQTIDSFADALFERWFPTPEARANQTLIVIDTLTNKSAIRTGDSVKAIVSDETAQSILQDNLGLPVRQGNKYNEGFLAASERLSALLSGQADPGAPVAADNLNVEGTFAKAEESDTKISTIWVIGFLIVATIVPMLTYYAYVGFPGR